MRGLDPVAVGNAFLDAPLSAGGWETALRLLARATGSARTQLVGVGDPDRLLFNLVTDQIPGAAEDLFAIGGLSRDVNWRASIDGPPLRIYHDVDYAEARGLRPHAAMADYLDHYEAPFGAHTTLIREPGTTFTLALLRSRSDGATRIEDVDSFAAIIPFAHAAARMEMALERRGGALLAGALDNLPAAVLVCDRAGRPVGLSAAAEAMLAAPDAPLRLVDGRAAARDGRADRHFQRLFETVLTRTAAHVRLRLGRPGAERSCTIIALPRRDWSFGFEPVAMIILKDGATTGADAIDLIRGALGLSAGEAEVALLCAQGLSREAIARHRNSAPETVKTQLRTLFRKTGVDRQAELAVLVTRLLD